MKKILILTIFALIFIAIPAKASAGCIIFCDKERKTIRIINNTNSSNINSNINSNTTGTYAGSNTHTPSYAYHNNDTPITVSCYSDPNSANVNENITWRVSVYGGNGNFNITWSGSEGLYGNGTSIVKRYNHSGSKNASVTILSGNQTVSRNCNSVEIYDNNYNNNNYNHNYNYNNNDYYDSNLSLTCSANVTFAPAGTTVIWQAYTSNSNYNYSYTWSGTDNMYGYGRSVAYVYNSPGPKYASVTARYGNRDITRQCSNIVTVGVPNQYYNQYPNTQVYKPYVAPVKTVIIRKEVTKPVEVKEEKVAEKNTEFTAASLFSLSNVPWGWVVVLIILVLMGTIVYLIVNKNKI